MHQIAHSLSLSSSPLVRKRGIISHTAMFMVSHSMQVLKSLTAYKAIPYPILFLCNQLSLMCPLSTLHT